MTAPQPLGYVIGTGDPEETCVHYQGRLFTREEAVAELEETPGDPMQNARLLVVFEAGVAFDGELARDMAVVLEQELAESNRRLAEARRLLQALVTEVSRTAGGQSEDCRDALVDAALHLHGEVPA